MKRRVGILGLLVILALTYGIIEHLASDPDPAPACATAASCEGGCTRGSAADCRQLGELRQGRQPDAASYALFATACERGDLRACADEGDDLLDGGPGVPKSLDRAIALVRTACIGGDLRGCAFLARAMIRGEGAAKDPAAALDLLSRGCQARYPLACALAGDAAMALGRFERARAGYGAACDLGLYRACSNLGVMFQDGDGVPPDLGLSRRLYARACDHGSQVGCENLAALGSAGAH